VGVNTDALRPAVRLAGPPVTGAGWPDPWPASVPVSCLAARATGPRPPLGSDSRRLRRPAPFTLAGYTALATVGPSAPSGRSGVAAAVVGAVETVLLCAVLMVLVAAALFGLDACAVVPAGTSPATLAARGHRAGLRRRGRRRVLPRGAPQPGMAGQCGGRRICARLPRSIVMASCMPINQFGRDCGRRGGGPW